MEAGARGTAEQMRGMRATDIARQDTAGRDASCVFPPPGNIISMTSSKHAAMIVATSTPM
eukprot:209787-Prymnesium_polylepis.1